MLASQSVLAVCLGFLSSDHQNILKLFTSTEQFTWTLISLVMPFSFSLLKSPMYSGKSFSAGCGKSFSRRLIGNGSPAKSNSICWCCFSVCCCVKSLDPQPLGEVGDLEKEGDRLICKIRCCIWPKLIVCDLEDMYAFIPKYLWAPNQV